MLDRPPPWIVAIGASGGDGLRDLKALVGALPPPLNAVVMVVLHRPIDRVSYLQSILSQSARLPVIIASNGERLEPGVICIGEPLEHLRLAGRSLGELVHDRRELHQNRTIDLLFQSVAEHGRDRTIGVVLSGALDDGSRGLFAIHDAGGLTMALTPEPLEHGMPENAVAFDGPLDVIGDVDVIAGAIQAAIRAERPPGSGHPLIPGE